MVYELNVISKHPNFDNKLLKKYLIDGMETIGVWGNEKFAIEFKNNTSAKTQIKLSLGGTDILTGKPADTSSNGDMWVVNPFSTLKVEAWPETKHGGAAFIFTNGDKSVAVHTHGNMASNDIIAAAIYTESYKPIINWWCICNGFCTCNYYSGDNWNSLNYKSKNIYSKNIAINNINSANQTLSADCSNSSILESTASIGAGEFTNQNLTSVAGLICPTYQATISLRYLWWDDLVHKLKNSNSYNSYNHGFPGDKPLMSLGNTPRINTTVTSPIQQNISRIY